ncbi:hypothetical protein ACHAXS_008720 [Conticribra weissflogii]
MCFEDHVPVGIQENDQLEPSSNAMSISISMLRSAALCESLCKRQPTESGDDDLGGILRNLVLCKKNG